ncbi:MAG: cytidine deaminase [Beijerinckiaceae bacterium]|nr:cytidine deaminase [Beijerinckiaceae bacterium]MDO9440452.1 cytidine deaminase [Beijerinckiaceae bacterium]
MHDAQARDLDDLFNQAALAQTRAYAPYSGFPVGAAIRDVAGQTHLGCNVENAAYPSGTCAEQSAISAMIAAGGTRIAAIAVLGPGEEPVTPCGACRQRLREFGDATTVVHAGARGGARRSFTLGELLPEAFGPALLAGAVKT